MKRSRLRKRIAYSLVEQAAASWKFTPHDTLAAFMKLQRAIRAYGRACAAEARDKGKA
jgi:hypothetical protein